MKNSIGLFKFISLIVLININFFENSFSMQSALTKEERQVLLNRYLKLPKAIQNTVRFSAFEAMSEEDRKGVEASVNYRKSVLSHGMSVEEWKLLSEKEKKARVERVMNAFVDINIDKAQNEIKTIEVYIKNRSFPKGFRSYQEYEDDFKLRWHMVPSEYTAKLRRLLINRGISLPKDIALKPRISR